MENPLLLEAIRVLNKQQRKQFGKYLTCRLFNKADHANTNIECYATLTGMIESHLSLPKKIIYHEINRRMGKTHSNKYLDNRMGDLMALFKGYLVWLETSNAEKKVHEELAAARFFREKEMSKHATKSVGRAQKAIDGLPKNLDKLPHYRYCVDDEIYQQEGSNNKRKGDLHTTATLKSLSVDYATKLLELALVILQQEQLVPGFQSEWKTFLQKQRSVFSSVKSFDNWTLRLLEEAIQLVELPVEKSYPLFQDFTRQIDEHASEIPLSILKNLAVYARKYCRIQIGEGDRQKEFQDIQLKLYKQHLKMGLLYENDKLPAWLFLNLVTVGLRYNELTWVWELLQNHRARVSGDESERFVHYAFAQYYFTCGKQKEVREHFLELQVSSVFKVRLLEKLVKTLEIKISYEAGEDELAKSKLKSFDEFLRRNKRHINSRSAEEGKSFIVMVRALLAEIERRNQEASRADKALKFENVISKINDLSYPLAERRWLQDAVSKLDRK